MFSTIADVVGPETIKDLISLYPSVCETDTTDDMMTYPDEVWEWILQTIGLVTGAHQWDVLWRFGLVLDSDTAAQRNCGDLWRPHGRIESSWYIPDDEDTPISIDNPPKVMT